MMHYYISSSTLWDHSDITQTSLRDWDHSGRTRRTLREYPEGSLIWNWCCLSCPNCDVPQKGASTLRSWGLSSDKLEPLGFPGLGWAAAAAASGQNNAVQAQVNPRHFGLQPKISSPKRLCWKMLVLSLLLLLPTLGQAANPAHMSSSWVGASLFPLFVCFSGVLYF